MVRTVSAAEASRESLPMRLNVLSCRASVDSRRTSVAATAIEKTPTAASVAEDRQHDQAVALVEDLHDPESRDRQPVPRHPVVDGAIAREHRGAHEGAQPEEGRHRQDDERELPDDDRRPRRGIGQDRRDDEEHGQERAADAQEVDGAHVPERLEQALLVGAQQDERRDERRQGEHPPAIAEQRRDRARDRGREDAGHQRDHDRHPQELARSGAAPRELDRVGDPDRTERHLAQADAQPRERVQAAARRAHEAAREDDHEHLREQHTAAAEERLQPARRDRRRREALGLVPGPVRSAAVDRGFGLRHARGTYPWLPMLAPGHISARLRSAGWIARSLMTDLRYGGVLRGDIRSRYRRAGAYNVVNSPYSVLPHIFRGRIGPHGRARGCRLWQGAVINWWLDQGLRNPMVGLEIDPAVASATARRLSAFGNVTIVHDDATTGVPDDATLLYMYNPFDCAATTRFKDNLARRFHRRGITALYWNPQWLEVFEGDPRWTTQLIELTRSSSPRIKGMDRMYAMVALRPA